MGWVSDDVKNLFKGENGSSNGSTAWSGSHTGSIVGGAVGGTVVVILAVVAFLLIRRRRSKKQWAAAQQQKPAANPEYTAAPSVAPSADASTSNYKYQPYAASSPGLYEAPSPDPGSNMVAAETSPVELQNHYGQATATPQGNHQRQVSTGLPILHSSQQPGRQSHFYEMP